MPRVHACTRRIRASATHCMHKHTLSILICTPSVRRVLIFQKMKYFEGKHDIWIWVLHITSYLRRIIFLIKTSMTSPYPRNMTLSMWMILFLIYPLPLHLRPTRVHLTLPIWICCHPHLLFLHCMVLIPLIPPSMNPTHLPSMTIHSQTGSLKPHHILNLSATSEISPIHRSSSQALCDPN